MARKINTVQYAAMSSARGSGRILPTGFIVAQQAKAQYPTIGLALSAGTNSTTVVNDQPA